MSEPITIAVIAGVFGVLAGVPAIVTAYLTQKTRQENTEQHGQSQQKLDIVARHVEITGRKVDHLGDRVDDLSVRHEVVAERLHRHMNQDRSDA